MNKNNVTLILKRNPTRAPADALCSLCANPIENLGNFQFAVFAERTNDFVCSPCIRKHEPDLEPMVRHARPNP